MREGEKRGLGLEGNREVGELVRGSILEVWVVGGGLD